MTDLRGKIKRTIDQTFGPFSDGVVERMACSISRVPEIAESQARIEELEAALAPFAAMIRPNTFDPKGIARFGVSGRAGNDDYRAAYAALNIAKDKGE
jgi:hypothetical protein